MIKNSKIAIILLIFSAIFVVATGCETLDNAITHLEDTAEVPSPLDLLGVLLGGGLLF